MTKKVAIALFNLGGPDNLKAVPKFLFNLFYDPAIINLPNPLRLFLATLISSLRKKTAQKIYQEIGGKSPILELTNAQAESLEKKLSFGDTKFKSFVVMRYWHPRAKKVIKEIKKFAPDEVLMLPLYPQFSSTTSGSSFKEFINQAKKQNLGTKFKQICCYPDNPDFINSHARLIKQAIAKAASAGHNDCRLLFSAHGLPQKIIDAGDPYVFQITKTVELITKELNQENLDFNICYQSKVGRMQWTSPSLDFEIRRAAIDKKPVIIIPIAFVSDHSETLVELDIEYKELAKELGIPFYLRVNALNSDGYFISALAKICQEAVKSNNFCVRNRICPKNLNRCPNHA